MLITFGEQETPQSVKSMTDITFFTTRPSGGGAEKVFVSLAREFSSNGYDTDLLVLNKNPRDHELGDVDLVELEASRIRYAVPKLVKYLNQRSPRAVYSTLTGPNIALLLASRFISNNPDIIVREAITRSVSADCSTGVKPVIQNFVLKHLYPTADTVVTLSDDSRQDLIKFVRGDGSNIIKIPNPVDPDRIHTLSEDPISHEWFTRDNTIVLAVGRLVPKNDFETLIQAFDEFKSDPCEKLIILGDGRKRDELQSFVAEKGINGVRFLGYVDNPYKYMASADVLALTSRYEGMPNTILEALACGTPIVATDSQGGTSDILAGGQYGQLADVGDVSEIAWLLRKTTNSEHDRERLKERAQQYSIETIADRYQELIR